MGITGQSVITYSEAANLAVNQTVVRSINTSIVAVLPIFSIIFVGAFLLGAGTLLDLAVALGIGMIAGTFSSLFIATPALVQLKDRTAEIKSLSARVHARRIQAAKKSAGSAGADSDNDDPAGLGAKSVAAAAALVVDAGPMERVQPRKQSRSKRKKGS